MRRPGIEPGSQEWESCMIPLHQRRFHIKLTLMIDNKYGKNLFPAILKKKIVTNIKIYICADAKMWNASRFCVSSLRRGHANLLCIVPILVYVLPKQVHQIWSKTCIESIATQVAETKRWLCRPTVLSQAWPCGLMDKAPDFGSGDCRFESCHGRVITFWTQFCLDEKMSQSAFYELLLRME